MVIYRTEKWVIFHGFLLVYHSLPIENGPVEIVDLAMNSMVIFHSYVNVYQRVTPFTTLKITVVTIDANPLSGTAQPQVGTKNEERTS